MTTGNANGSCGRAGTAVWIWIVVVVLISSAPYLYSALHGESAAGADGTYNWLLPPYPEDSLAYTGWVKQAASGSLLFEVKFTQIPHRAVLFQPLFLLVGWLAAVTGWEAGFALFVTRVLAVVVFLLVLYRFSGLFLRRGPERAVGLALVTLSSGLGGWLPADVEPSADLWMPEINTLWSLTWNLVFVVALTLMLGAIGAISRVTSSDPENGRLRPYLVAGLLTGLLAFVHTYDLIVVCGVVVLVIVVRMRGAALRPLVAFLVVPLLAGALQWFIANHHPVLSAHSLRGAMASPSIVSYLLALGLPGLLALYGTVQIWRSKSLDRFTPLLIWITASLALAYTPIWFQRKLIMGIHIPVSLIAAVGLTGLARWLSFGKRPLFAAIATGIVLVSGATHLQVVTAMAEEMRQDPTAYFVPAPLEQAFRFLGTQTDPDSVVLAHYHAARHIPGASGNTVTLGHWAQSVDLEQQMHWLGTLFSRTGSLSAAQRQAALRASSIDYVLLEPRMLEQWLGGNVPAWLDAMGETVYDADGVRVIEIKRGTQSD